MDFILIIKVNVSEMDISCVGLNCKNYIENCEYFVFGSFFVFCLLL